MNRTPLATLAAVFVLSACQGGRDADTPGLNLAPRAGDMCMAEGESVTLAEFEGNAGLPGDGEEHPLPVPAGCEYDALTVHIEWDLLVEDLDLEIVDPEGAVAGSSSDFNPQSGSATETAIVASPVAGEYKARVNNFAGVLTPYSGRATLDCTTPGGCFATGDGENGGGAPRPQQPATPTTRVVVSVIDSAFNPYHEFFYAGSAIYEDAAPSAVTPAVLQELGVKPENVLELTRSGNLQPDLDTDAAIWSRVKRGETYWVKGTNVVMISFAGGEHPALMPTVDKSPHGIGTSAAVLTANPEAVILFVETDGALGSDVAHDFAFLHPAVDILTTSYGVSIPSTGFPLPEWRTFRNSYPAVVELGKLHFSSGGNGPGLTPLRAGAGPWWSIGVSGIEEGDSEGRTALSGNFPDFLADFFQELPYCHTGQDCYRSVGGTSFSAPRAAGVASKVLLEARRAHGHRGGITTLAGQPVMAAGGELPVSNWFLRRSLEQAAFVPDTGDYDPVTGLTDLLGVPVNPAAPWLQIGWGDLSALPEKGVVSAALAHLGLGGEPREKTMGFCEFQTEVILQRKTYWDNIAATLPGVLGGDTPPPPLDEDPFIYCASSAPTHPASNDPGGGGN